MTNIKHIDFIVHPKRAAAHLGIKKYNGRRAMLNFPVDLGKLDGGALALAKRVIPLGFDGSDDSFCGVRSTRTRGELFAEKIRRDWGASPYERDFTHGGHDSAEAYIADRIARFDGGMATRELIDWKFDSLRPDESPEQYFIRHAQMITNAGGVLE